MIDPKPLTRAEREQFMARCQQIGKLFNEIAITRYEVTVQQAEARIAELERERQEVASVLYAGASFGDTTTPPAEIVRRLRAQIAELERKLAAIQYVGEREAKLIAAVKACKRVVDRQRLDTDPPISVPAVLRSRSESLRIAAEYAAGEERDIHTARDALNALPPEVWA